jgi:zinc protease
MLAFYALAHRLSAYPPEDVRYVPTLAERITRLQAVTAEQVKALYESQASSTAGELAIVGDFEPDAARKLLDKHLTGWKSEVAYQRVERPAKPVPGGRETIVTPDKANAVYVAGQTMPLRDTDPAYPALVVGNYLFGQAPLASRLSNRVRGKEGLSYGVGSMVAASPIDKSGRLMLYAITNPKNMPKVESAIGEELTKFLEKGASASETEEAKKAYLQSQKERRANDRVLASLLVETLYAGRTFAYYAEQEKKIDAVQPGDVKRAFDQFIDPKKLIIIEAGDLSGGKKTDKK